jgi:uncharacterized protein YdhG (YjbR/CyaY superfamily)
MPGPVSEYLAEQPPAARKVLARVRAILRKALPGATEGLSYRIPVYKIEGRMVLYFAGFAAHYSIYPVTAAVTRELGEAIADRLHGRGTIRFAYDEPVPVRLITRIARVRAAEARASRIKARARKR